VIAASFNLLFHPMPLRSDAVEELRHDENSKTDDCLVCAKLLKSKSQLSSIRIALSVPLAAAS